MVQLTRGPNEQESVSRVGTREAECECQPVEGTAMSHGTERTIGTEQVAATKGRATPPRSRPHCADHPRPSAMLTVHELAALLHCSTRTIYRLTAGGRRAPALTKGREWPRRTLTTALS